MKERKKRVKLKKEKFKRKFKDKEKFSIFKITLSEKSKITSRASNGYFLKSSFCC